MPDENEAQRYGEAIEALGREAPGIIFVEGVAHHGLDVRAAQRAASQGRRVCVNARASTLVVWSIEPTLESTRIEALHDKACALTRDAQAITDALAQRKEIAGRALIGMAAARSAERTVAAVKALLGRCSGGPAEASEQLEAMAQKLGTPLATCMGRQRPGLQVWYRSDEEDAGRRIAEEEELTGVDAKAEHYPTIWRAETAHHLRTMLARGPEFGRMRTAHSEDLFA